MTQLPHHVHHHRLLSVMCGIAHYSAAAHIQSRDYSLSTTNMSDISTGVADATPVVSETGLSDDFDGASLNSHIDDDYQDVGCQLVGVETSREREDGEKAHDYQDVGVETSREREDGEKAQYEQLVHCFITHLKERGDSWETVQKTFEGFYYQQTNMGNSTTVIEAILDNIKDNSAGKSHLIIYFDLPTLYF
jgi:hypothetical protein